MEEKISVTSAGGVELDYEIAGLGGRSFAFIIDWHIRIAAALTWFLASLYLFFKSFNLDLVLDVIDDNKGMYALFVFAVIIPTMVIYFLYNPILEVIMHGRTPGKRMAGVRVINKDGYTASVGAILVRNIFRLIDSFPVGMYTIGFLVAAFNRKKLRLGDMAAGTVLVYENKPDVSGINDIIANEQTSRTMQDRELTVELVRRWKQLQPGSRIELATRLLENFGERPPEAESRRKLDRLLYQRLTAMIQGNERVMHE